MCDSLSVPIGRELYTHMDLTLNLISLPYIPLNIPLLCASTSTLFILSHISTILLAKKYFHHTCRQNFLAQVPGMYSHSGVPSVFKDLFSVIMWSSHGIQS